MEKVMKNMAIAVFVIVVFGCLTTVPYACDRKEPLCVARTILEQGITFKLDNTKDFYCTDNAAGYEASLKMKKRIIDYYKSKGVDYFKQAKFDLSKIKYKITHKESGEIIVKATGSVFLKIEGTGFQDNKPLESIFRLKKEAGEKFCYPENGLIKD